MGSVRYVAIGDSFTEGVGDEPAPGVVRFLDKDGAPVAGLDKDVQYQTDPRGAVLALVRSR